MKLKSNVIVERNRGIFLRLNGVYTRFDRKWEGLLVALQNNITDENDLVKILMPTEDNNDVRARLSLSQFVTEYGVFLEDNGHEEIN